MNDDGLLGIPTELVASEVLDLIRAFQRGFINCSPPKV